MAEPYLGELISIIGHMQLDQATKDKIVCKHFFSGAAAYVDDHIFMSISPSGLALKLPDQDCRSLFDKGAKELRYFPKAPVKKGYAVLPPEITGDAKVLQNWVVTSILFVLNAAR